MPVILPVFIIVISNLSFSYCEDDGVKGASPLPGILISTNWPALKISGVSGLNLKVFIVGLSSITSSTSVFIGKYGLSIIIYALSCPNNFTNRQCHFVKLLRGC